jgi:DNA-binding NarL/FixJ family response regulator
MRPIVVIEDPERASTRVAAAIAAVRAAGWTAVPSWSAPRPGERLVCTGTVASADDARQALLAVLAGAGLVVKVTADRPTVDQFVDDLRRLGPVDHLTAGTAPPARLDAEQRALLDLLADGLTLGEAAHELALSRRTADRRLAGARRILGVATTAEAILASRS